MATPILMPRQGQSVESCILVKWLVKSGDAVAAGQPVASIETDKATFEVEAPAAGTVLALFFDEGADVPVLTHIGAVGAPGEDVASLRPGGVAARVDETAKSTSSESGTDHRSPITDHSPTSAPDPRSPITDHSAAAAPAAGGVSPRARGLAAKHGVDAAQLPGSGPGGRVIARDVEAAAAGAPRLTAAARAAGAPHGAAGSGLAGMVRAGDRAAPAAKAAPAAAPTTIPVKGIRKIIAERMTKSLGGTAQLTINRSFDATALVSFREKVKARGEAHGLPAVTLNDLIVFALARTLPRHPALNAHFLGDRMVQFPGVNLGIAVDTPRGLMVPVLRGVEAMSLAQVASSIKPLAKACQDGRVSPDDLQGGTFTITNLGALGVDHFTPVLNAPEVAILGVGGLWLKPVRADGGVKHVDAITLSLTIDHQAVDGAPAARFLKDLCETLENLELLLASS